MECGLRGYPSSTLHQMCARVFIPLKKSSVYRQLLHLDVNFDLGLLSLILKVIYKAKSASMRGSQQLEWAKKYVEGMKISEGERIVLSSFSFFKAGM